MAIPRKDQFPAARAPRQTRQRNIKLAIHILKDGSRRLYFSTDTTMRGIDVIAIDPNTALNAICVKELIGLAADAA